MGRTRSDRADRLQIDRGAAGKAPVVDQVAPPTVPSYAEPVDALAALLAETTEGNPALTPKQRAMIIHLDRARQTRLDYERKMKALGPIITELQRDLIALIPELELDFMQPFGPEDDGQGTLVKPYMKRPVWPAYRENPETGEKFKLADLIDALSTDDGTQHLVEVKVNHNGWTGYVRKRVEAWRDKCGGPAGDGVTNADGQFVDHDGVALDLHEVADPCDDALALPAFLRKLIAPAEMLEIHFTRTPIASRPVAEMHAAEQAAAPVAGD